MSLFKTASALKQRFKATCEELWIFIFAWIPTPLGMALRLAAWRWFFASCGTVRFETGLTIANMGNIALGNGVRIGKGSFLTAANGKLDLAANVAIAPCVNIGADNGFIKIGQNSAIGPGTVIRAANHRFDSPEKPITEQGHAPGQVIIGEDVWIGANCVITPGSVIGAGTVVGAGAVVTKELPAYIIAAGVPARKIGQRGGNNANGAKMSGF